MDCRHINTYCASGITVILTLAVSGIEAASLAALGSGENGPSKLGFVSEVGCLSIDREDPKHGFFTSANHEKAELFSVYFIQAAKSYDGRKIKLTGKLSEDRGQRYLSEAAIAQNLGACTNDRPGLEASVPSGSTGSPPTKSTRPNAEVGCIHIDPLNPAHGWLTSGRYPPEYPLVVYFKSGAKSYENRLVRITGRWTVKHVAPTAGEAYWGATEHAMEVLADATIDSELGTRPCSGSESSNP